MASKRELLKAAMADVRAGKPRQEVFDNYRAQVNHDKHLSFAVASVAEPQRIPQGEKYNKILFGLLVFAAVTKGLSALAMGGGLVMLLLGLVVPVVFAIGVRKYEALVYPLLVILAGISALRALLSLGDEGAWMLIEVALLGAIAWLAFQVQRSVFPNINWFKVRQDAQGNYVW
jgi:hypothetical protein